LIAASSDAVWVPLRDGLARVDATTGEVVAVMPMTYRIDRGVVVFGGRVAVTDGNGLRFVDTDTNTLGEPHPYAGTGELQNRLVVISRRLYLATSSGSILRLDESYTPTGETAIPNAPDLVSFRGAGNSLWATSYLRVGVPQTDAATDQIVIRVDPE